MADGKRIGRLGVREIARAVGVAPMTVSRVLSNPDLVAPETRAKVLEAIERAGFVPNRLASSMRGAGRMIGTVVPPLINSGIAEQVQGMSDECHESGYSMLLVQGEFTAGGRGGGDPHAARLAAGGDDPAELRADGDGARAPGDERGAGGRDLRDQGAGADRHGGRRLELRDGLRDDHASGRQGLQADRLRLDADPRQRPAAAAAHGLSCRARPSSASRTTTTWRSRCRSPRRAARRRWSTLTDRHPDIDAIFFSSATRWRSARSRNATAAAGRCPSGIAIAGYGDMDLAAQLFPAADHGAGQPLRDGAARGAAAAGAARRRREGRRPSPASASRSSTARAPRPSARLSRWPCCRRRCRAASPSPRRGR